MPQINRPLNSISFVTFDIHKYNGLDDDNNDTQNRFWEQKTMEQMSSEEVNQFAEEQQEPYQ